MLHNQNGAMLVIIPPTMWMMLMLKKRIILNGFHHSDVKYAQMTGHQLEVENNNEQTNQY